MIDKQQLQAMGEHQAEQHMCMAKQIEDLQARLQECAKGAAKMQEQRDNLADLLYRTELGAGALKRLKSACVVMGISTPESIEELGAYQARYVSMLIDEAHDVCGLAHDYDVQRQQLSVQLEAANRKIAVMAELLRDSCDINKALGFLIDLSENDGKEDALSILSEHLDKCESLLSSELSDHFAGTGNQPEPPAWRNTGHPNGLKRFLTQKQYEAQTPGVQQWFEPIGFNLPDGWQIVPVEPTQEMVEVGCEHEGSRINDGAGYARVLYAKMLAAAPKPEQAK